MSSTDVEEKPSTPVPVVQDTSNGDHQPNELHQRSSFDGKGAPLAEADAEDEGETIPAPPLTPVKVSPLDRLERLPGEQDAMVLKFLSTDDCAALLSPVDLGPTAISFVLTTMRVMALPENPRLPQIIIPIPMLDSWISGKENAFYTLELNTKHIWSFKIGFRREREGTSAKMALDSLKATRLAQLPAFEVGTAALKEEEQGEVSNYGWNMFDEQEDLHRQICLDPQSEDKAATDPEVGLGKDLRPWFRNTNLGQPDNSFGLSPTYPFYFAVPSSCSDEFLIDCLQARSRGRIPAISFVHLRTGGVLARSSQPLTFKGKNRVCDGDLCAFLVNAYTPASAQPRLKVDSSPRFESPTRKASGPGAGWRPPPSLADDSSSFGSPPQRQGSTHADASATGSPGGPTSTPSESSSPPRRLMKDTKNPLQVYDLRPYAAATGNLATGGGYETGNFYEHCKVTFAGIDNIHGVTASWNKLRQLVVSHSGRNYKSDFYKEWDETKWIDHIQKILVASTHIADLLEKGESVLAHCTDGWDRTSQATSLCMLLLDPFYRTIHGFCILIEKEWCSFGHKFAERCNHLVTGTTFCAADNVVASDVDPNGQSKIQTSPVFIQFLDCVFQVVRQFPQHFEFTPCLLEYLSYQVYGCLFGTFLTNTAKERMFEGIRLKTVSLWTEVERITEEERRGKRPLHFINPSYDAATAAKHIKKEVNCGIHRITPSVSSKRLVFWEEFYLKHDPDMWRLGMNQQGCMGEGCPPTPSSGSADAAAGSITSNAHVVPAWVQCNPVTELHDELVVKAKKRRQEEVEAMEELLPRLNVPRPTMQQEKEGVVVRPQPDRSKECRRCRDKFGWFNSAQHCQHCFQAFCSKCLKQGPPTYQKLCESCFTFQESQPGEM